MSIGNNGDGIELRALVCDDENVAREYLKLVLNRIDGVEVVGEAVDAVECFRQVGECSPDVVFLDINLPDKSGIDVAKALSDLSDPPKLVFVTGYDEYAVSAFDLAAADYVMKPYDQERIEKTVSRIKSVSARDMKGGLSGVSNGFHKLPIKHQDSVKLVDPKHICFARTEGRKTLVRTKTASFLTPYTLAELEKRLGGEGFFRANEGCLVNLDCVKEVLYYGPRTYELLLGDPDQTYVPLSRSRAQKLKEMLDL